MVNILLAGHETTAIALSWTLYYLSINPEAERRFHEELSSVMKNNRGASGDIDRMPITEMILKESMRLRPPVWILGRVALEDDILPSGRPIPARTEVLMLPYIAHRNPTFFPDPESFIPERFSEERQQDLPPFVYFPFGGGPRGCMGETFARTEALIILAEVGKRFRLRLEPGHPVVPKPLVTLRPKDGIRMRVLPRDDFSLQDDSRSLAAEETRIRSRHQVA
jgi:cytochrome P450